MRAGRLVHAKILSNMRGRRGNAKRRGLVLHAGDPRMGRGHLLAGDTFSRAMRMPAGDPFSFRVPKFLKKLSLKKVAGALGSVASGVGGLALKLAPSIAGIVGGPMAAGTVSQALGALSSFTNHEAPVLQGPPGLVSAQYQAGYQVPGVEVESTYTGARSRGTFTNTHEDEGEDGDQGEDVTAEDTGDDADNTDTGDDAGEETP
jgi:hypothetical protein